MGFARYELLTIRKTFQFSHVTFNLDVRLIGNPCHVTLDNLASGSCRVWPHMVWTRSSPTSRRIASACVGSPWLGFGLDFARRCLPPASCVLAPSCTCMASLFGFGLHWIPAKRHVEQPITAMLDRCLESDCIGFRPNGTWNSQLQPGWAWWGLACPCLCYTIRMLSFWTWLAFVSLSSISI